MEGKGRKRKNEEWKAGKKTKPKLVRNIYVKCCG